MRQKRLERPNKYMQLNVPPVIACLTSLGDVLPEYYNINISHYLSTGSAPRHPSFSPLSHPSESKRITLSPQAARSLLPSRPSTIIQAAIIKRTQFQRHKCNTRIEGPKRNHLVNSFAEHSHARVVIILELYLPFPSS